jgi:ADP-heptose:LPS heptosyltransferase
MMILLSEMGSLVLARPMFDRLRKKYPAAALYALVFEQNKGVLDILEVVPEENILTVRNDSISHFTADSVGAWRTMRKLGIDTVLDCELFSRISSIYSFLSGAEIRVGFHPYTQEGLYRGNFINRPVLYNPYQHISGQFINLVEAIESDGVPLVKRPVGNDTSGITAMTAGRDEIAAMSARLTNNFPQVQGKTIILIYAGGGLLPIRAWPLSYFCSIAQDFSQNDYVVGIIGLKQDKEIAAEIVSHCRSANCIDLTGYTKTVRELMLLFHLASLLITNDGGPGHFAAMTPIPAIIFYGPETPALYGSLDGESINLYASLSCSPCLTAYNHRKSPCDGDNQCLKSIHPETVLKKSYAILENQKFSSASDG